MNESKSWWQSKAVWGGLISAASVIAGLFGVHIDEATQATIVDGSIAAMSAAGVVFGAILSVVGRIKATATIG